MRHEYMNALCKLLLIFLMSENLHKMLGNEQGLYCGYVDKRTGWEMGTGRGAQSRGIEYHGDS